MALRWELIFTTRCGAPISREIYNHVVHSRGHLLLKMQSNQTSSFLLTTCGEGSVRRFLRHGKRATLMVDSIFAFRSGIVQGHKGVLGFTITWLLAFGDDYQKLAQQASTWWYDGFWWAPLTSPKTAIMEYNVTKVHDLELAGRWFKVCQIPEKAGISIDAQGLILQDNLTMRNPSKLGVLRSLTPEKKRNPKNTLDQCLTL